MSKTIQAHSRIRWHYKLFLANGHLVEASEDPQGDSLQLGQEAIHPNIESLLIGLQEGEQARFIVLAEDAFGYPDPNAVHEVARDSFPAEMDLKPNQIISFALPSGQEIPGHIVALKGDKVTVDFNHPLAGQNLNVEVEILTIDVE